MLLLNSLVVAERSHDFRGWRIRFDQILPSLDGIGTGMLSVIERAIPVGSQASLDPGLVEKLVGCRSVFRVFRKHASYELFWVLRHMLRNDEIFVGNLLVEVFVILAPVGETSTEESK